MSFFDGIRSLFTARKAEDIQNGENVVDVIDTSGVPDEQIYYMSHTIAAGLLGIE